VAARRGREGKQEYEENDKTSSGCPNNEKDKRESAGKAASSTGPLPDKVV
jgi:hypothetical protein